MNKVATIALSLVLVLGLETSSMAIEQPAYKLELDAKPFQIRDYAPLIVATVHVAGARSDAVNEGFRILADYIFGNNRKKSTIAMTAPVTQSASEKIAMTAPVTQSGGAGGWDVSFTMPASYTLQTLPEPNDARVHLVDVRERRVAVIVYSGFWSDANIASHQAQLQDFVRQRGLKAISPPIYAFYDPPWMPWFFRTNEVQIEIAKP
jgi:hypothetical protein